MGFLGRPLTPTQQHYSIYVQELLALISALEKWKHLLRCARVTAYTDHRALTYLQQLKISKPLCRRTGCWLNPLAEFSDLTITYVQGKRNVMGDALSRHPQYLPPTPPSAVPAEPFYSSGVLAALVAAQPEAVLPTYQYNTRRTRRNFRAEAAFPKLATQQRPSYPKTGKKPAAPAASSPTGPEPDVKTVQPSSPPAAIPPTWPATPELVSSREPEDFSLDQLSPDACDVNGLERP